jgi:hypothetical protein
MSTVNNKLTNLADEIRELSGVTEPLGLDEMVTNVNTANTDVATMAGLIEELNTALDGKSVSGGGAGVETVTAKVYGATTVIYTAVVDGALVTQISNGDNGVDSNHEIVTCANSPVVCCDILGVLYSNINGYAQRHYQHGTTVAVWSFDRDDVISFATSSGGGN